MRDPKRSEKQWFMANYGKELPTDKAAKILEISPGTGEVCDLLCTNLGYVHYTGLDITDAYHQESSDYIKNRIRVVPDTLEYLHATAETYDLILIQHCLEHIPKIQQKPLISAVRARLRKGGILIVEVPNIANMFVGPYHRYSDTTHEIGFTDCSLEWTLRHGGFDPAEIEVRSTRVPLTSVGRYIQALLQMLLNKLQELLIYAYIPSGRIITSMYLCAIVRRHV